LDVLQVYEYSYHKYFRAIRSAPFSAKSWQDSGAHIPPILLFLGGCYALGAGFYEAVAK
jgi:hypothetical protein